MSARTPLDYPGTMEMRREQDGMVYYANRYGNVALKGAMASRAGPGSSRDCVRPTTGI